MSHVVFILLLGGFWLISYYQQWSLVWPALVTAIWLIGRVRSRNLQRIRDQKASQIIHCAAALGVPEYFVDNYFERDDWKSRDSYNDVHPGRIAEQLAEEFKAQR
ncbi:hypothetical protein IC617_11620 [Neiella sp. HB171785]|uniref:Uncharacterized protein n=1 Tax=Neiella litorisoli TaxID=2771431 RepID=A0A8J6QSP3_9GAMM|nr:hypothetical protein [Neiella litorisoli]MBD1390079.1 hypothetical protein [Neiella litorisoli]